MNNRTTEGARTATTVLVLAGILLLFAAPVFAATYTINVKTDHASYSGAEQITISGTVSPAPGPDTAAFVQVQNPSHATVAVDDAQVDPSTGAYSYTFTLGGTSNWVAGNYSVGATWGGSGTVITGNTTFAYTPTSTTTTSTTSTSSTVPEFNSQALLLTALVAVSVVAVLGNRFVPLRRR